jgi:ribosomal subunit interface protein
MHVHLTYLHAPRTPQLDKVIQSRLSKLEKLLEHFSSDLVQLHGALESNTARKNSTCSLNLSLPTAQIHAREEGINLLTNVQACFDHLEEQLKKHKRGLRREEVWKRRRPRKTSPRLA